MKKTIILLILFLILGCLIFYNIQVVVDFAGRYIYPLDDAYIHLSMAKNFAEFQTWGITQYEFSSTTSSPLFTFLLAVLIKVFGNWEYIPLVANSLAGIGLIVVFHRYLKQFSTSTSIVILSAVVLLMPLHLMIMTGMEHVFHTLAMILVLLAFQKYLEDKAPRNFSNLALFSIIAVGFRYESLFFIFFICVYLFFVKKEYVIGIALGLFAMTPVVVYGLISIDKGSFFLPNSLLLKGNLNDGVQGFLMRAASNAYRGLSVLLLVLILFIQIYRNSRTLNLSTSQTLQLSKNAIPFVVVCGFAVHVLLANFGWLIRYESYLVALVLFAIIPFVDEVFQKNTTNRILKFGILFILLIPLYTRFVRMFDKQALASKNIFDQQIQMADFLKTYYNNSWIMANDIGAITYFTNIHLLDTYGLGNAEVARLRKEDHTGFTDNIKLKNYIKSQAEHYDLAIVYDSWIKLPNHFDKIATWTIKDNYICGDNEVTFYALQKENRLRLRNQLIQFSKKTPKDVIVKIEK